MFSACFGDASTVILDFRRALTASLDSCAEIECLFSGVTKSGRVWRKVPESGDRSVECPFSGVTKSGRVWRKVPESGARSVGNALCASPLSARQTDITCTIKKGRY